MLLCSKGTSSIQVIILDFPEFEEVVEWDGMAFKEMKNLKTLIIRVGSFSKGPEHLPNSLRVLEWSGYPSPSLPPNFHPKRLVTLELRQSCLMSLDLLKMLNINGRSWPPLKLCSLEKLKLSSCY